MRRWMWIWFAVLLAGGAREVCAQAGVEDFGLALFGGPAWKTGASSQPFQMGAGVDASLYRMRRGRVGVGPEVEGGFYHPALSGIGNYYVSADAIVGRERSLEEMRLRPFAAAGYTRFFNATKTALSQADAVNFGVGVDRAIGEDLWLRVDVREHYTPGTGTHALVLRIGIVGMQSLR
ncbi:MAG TPA: hypothetical protein VGU23_07210 [Acidobacteriaceae bacterium]|nr:hypothetical protein [Acidobacteriaceae bacterium]